MRLLLACLALTAVACGETTAPEIAAEPCSAPTSEPDRPTRQCALDPAAILEPSDAGTSAQIALYLVVPSDGQSPRRAWGRADAELLARETFVRTAEIYEACDIGFDLLAAEVLVVPESMQTIVGNATDSWGGEAPPGEDDPDAFNHARGERLADDPRALFSLRSEGLHDGALGIFVVDDIVYHAAQEPTPASGLSFAPVVFHHPDDFPLRNAVLVASAHGGLGQIPSRINGRTVAHELAHMLLDTGTHDSEHNGGDSDALMLGGDVLFEGECQIMRDNIARLYGDDPVIDPLDP